MRKLMVGIVLVVAISMLFVPVAFAQQAPGATYNTGAWNIGLPGTLSQTGFTGNEAIVVESGKVASISATKGVKDGLQMKFKTDQGADYTVFLGPKWFVEHQKIKFMPGDDVVVKGKKWSSYIIATEISKGDWTMKLRSQEDGQPSWECCYPGTVKLQ